MRQGNGSDLLGANDPRSATIGVIYVAPNDDRESVIAAILTQEKLGRKQIAIVLPQQNKAFQRPVDFDGLKNMRSTLQANLVIVAPHGSSPAEFARQRRFTYFTSLENYGKSLREENEAARASRAPRGGRWPFSRRQSRLQPIANDANDAPDDIEVIPVPLPQVPAAPPQSPQTVHEVPIDQEDTHPLAHAAAPGGPAGAGDLPAAQPAPALPEEEDHVVPSLPLPVDVADEDLELPAASSPHVGDSSLPQNIPAPNEMAAPLPAQQQPASQLPQAPEADDDSADIITFPTPARSRSSGTLPAPPPPDIDELDDNDIAVVMPPPAPVTRRNAGKTPAGTPPAASAPSTPGRRRTTVVLPPVVPPPASPTARPPRRRRSAWQLLLLLLLALLLFSCVFCGVLAVAAPGVVPVPIKNYVSNLFGGGRPGATVTITPKSANELNTYVITGVTTGNADSTKRQVAARQLTFTTQPTSKTAKATGRVDIPATHATGTLTFYNGNTIDYGVTAHTVFTDANGVQIENDSAVDIPAGSVSGGFGRITVPATAVTSGSAGNIGALDFNQMQCCGSNAVLVSNGSFSGGQDPQQYTDVQQSDIDGAANPLKPQLQQAALTSLNAQLHTNEQFVNKPSCTSKITSDHLPGDKVSSVTVTVTATCSGYAYDQTAAQSLATELLKNKAKSDLQDPHYAQVGNVTANVASASVNKGTITLFVKAQGLWVYQFNDAIKKQLAQQIAGKKKKDARTFLQRQPEIGAVGKIDVPGNDDTVMPTDYTQISIVVQNPAGVPGTAGSPSGTSTTGGSSPGSTGSSTAKP